MENILVSVREQIRRANAGEPSLEEEYPLISGTAIAAPETNPQKFGLCKGRHEIPGVRRYVFGTDVNPLDPAGLEWEAAQYFRHFSGMRLQDRGGILLYVTGLTVALVAVLNACRNQRILVTLMHYDRESGEYYPQQIAQ